MTDVVESFRVKQIKLEFTDGSVKVLTDVATISISADDYETLNADTD